MHVSGMILEAAAGVECSLVLAGRPETELSPPCPQLVRASFCGTGIEIAPSAASRALQLLQVRLQFNVVVPQTSHGTTVRRCRGRLMTAPPTTRGGYK